MIDLAVDEFDEGQKEATCSTGDPVTTSLSLFLSRDSFSKLSTLCMVEPLLSGIVLGLVPVTLAGLFVTAYLQYRRGDRVTNSL